MIQFNIQYKEDILAGKYRVVNRRGTPVRIICWDKKSEDDKYPIVGLENKGNIEHYATFTLEGCRYSSVTDGHDLFLIPNTKFQVGDWIVKKNGEVFSEGSTAQMIDSIDFELEKYILSSGTYIKFHKADNYRLWNWTDIQNGDFIYIKQLNNEAEWLMIVEYIDDPFERIHVYYDCVINCDNSMIDYHIYSYWGNASYAEIIHPATKEQQKTLIEKIHDSGYYWNFLEKKLEISNVEGKLLNAARKVLSNKKEVIKFLKDAGIIDKSGQLSEVYRT